VRRCKREKHDIPRHARSEDTPARQKTDGVNETRSRRHSEEGVGSDFLRRGLPPVEAPFIILAVGFFPTSILFSFRVSTTTIASTANSVQLVGELVSTIHAVCP
jgi:hypothetical protein